MTIAGMIPAWRRLEEIMKEKKPMIGLLIAIIVFVLIIAIGAVILIMRGSGVKEEFASVRAYRGLDALSEEVTVDPIDLPFPDPSGTGNEQELRQKAFEAYTILNDARIAQGLAALRWDADLEMIASIRAEEIFTQFNPDHTRPDGTAWYTVNPSIMLGENIYKGKGDPAEVMRTWMNHDTDSENFFSADCTKIAIAVYMGDDGTYTWAAIFGTDVP